MWREPKTDRPLGLAVFGAGWSVWAIAQKGDTLAPSAYATIRLAIHTERQFFYVAVAMLIVQTAALVIHEPWLRIILTTVALLVWATFGVVIYLSAPTALLPGYTVVMALCNSLGLFDTVRERFPPP